MHTSISPSQEHTDMENANQETIILTTNAGQFTIVPGDKLDIPLLIMNQGNSSEQLRISVEGIPLVWVSIDQQVILVQPGQQTRLTLTIHPPEPPKALIGRYNLVIRATSLADPERTIDGQAAVTVAGFEVKGRIGVLLEGVRFSVIPGGKLQISAVLINQGLVADTFRLAFGDLPEGWTAIPEPLLRLQPGEIRNAALVINPPREPSTRATRYPIRILITSQEAPDQAVSIDCILTVSAFTEFKSSLEAAQPDQNLHARLLIKNLSNIPVSFRVSWNSPEEPLQFEPEEPQQLNVPIGEEARLELCR
jgi:uncharacterized membrane protein